MKSSATHRTDKKMVFRKLLAFFFINLPLLFRMVDCDATILQQQPSTTSIAPGSTKGQFLSLLPISSSITPKTNLETNSSQSISNQTTNVPITAISATTSKNLNFYVSNQTESNNWNTTTKPTTISLNSSATIVDNNKNGTTITSTSQQTSTQVSVDPNLPKKGAAEEERHSSMAIFFVLSVIASCIFLIHFILETKFQYIPESLSVVFLGAAIGLVMKLSSQNLGDWKKEETLNPTMFFLVMLPPIIYESGYTLHKGNFFQNIGSILVFAIVGTSISAFVIGGGVYILGALDLAYKLSFTESFAFGSLISAVDPVATLAIFHALNLDPILNMLVFGESILNDAVAIVLATTALELNHLDKSVSGTTAILNGFVRFFIVFFGSAVIGAAFALLAALVFKYIDLRKHPSLEFGMMLILIYAPYGLAEGLHLSGIMAILFNGVVMSHYAHFNLSPVTQITMQQTLRTLAFIAETCVFAYLGLAIFSFHMKIELSLIIWSIILCLIGRAVNIYPLSYLVNYFREHKISKKMMFVMWFSGLRGAIAYALALHLDFEEEKRRVIVTTTLIIVLFTIIVLGSSTMPVLKFMNRSKRSKGRRRRGSRSSKRLITLSKTQEMGQAIETEHLSELTEEELEVSYRNESNLKGFVRFDARYMMPFFTRIFTDQEVKDCKSQMTDLTNRWYQTVRRPSESEEERDNLYNSDDDDYDNYDDYDDQRLFDENRNNHFLIDAGHEDDAGILADVEEGRMGLGKVPHPMKSLSHKQSSSHPNSEKQSLFDGGNNNSLKNTTSKKLSKTKKSSSSSSNNHHHHHHPKLLKNHQKSSLLNQNKNYHSNHDHHGSNSPGNGHGSNGPVST